MTGMARYNFKETEAKWQKAWTGNRVFAAAAAKTRWSAHAVCHFASVSLKL